ncbi:MAG: TolC family protein [bacterium]|nr:TolC family protein [bacterium]
MALLFTILFLSFNLKDLIEEAKSNNLEIISARYEALSKNYVKSYITALPDPSFGLGYRKTPEFFIRQKIPFPSKLKNLGESAALQIDYYRYSLAIKEAQIISDLKSKYYELWYLYQERRALDELLNILSDLERSADALYRLDRTDLQSVIRTRVERELTLAKLSFINSEISRVIAYLSYITAKERKDGWDLVADQRVEPYFIDLDDIREIAIRNSPFIGIQLISSKISEFELEYEKLSYVPDLVLSFDTMMGAPAFFVEIEIPIWFWKNQKNRVLEKQKNLLSSQSLYESEKLRILSTVESLKNTINSFYEFSVAYAKAIEQTYAAFESAKASWMLGKSPFSDVIDLLVLLYNYKIDLANKIYLNRAYTAELEKYLGLEIEKLVSPGQMKKEVQKP